MSKQTLTQDLHDLIDRKLYDLSPKGLEESRSEIEKLLAAGANLNHPTLDAQGEAAYPLALAASAGSVRWVRFLLDLGAKPQVELRQEKSEQREAPVSPFSPLSRAINALEFALEDDDENLEDRGVGPVGVIRELLSAGANPLSPDPYRHPNAFAEWLRVVEEVVHPPFSASQVDTVVEVTDMMLSALPSELSKDFKGQVLSMTPNAAIKEARVMVDQWPAELREAWRTRTIAQDMEHQIPTTEEVGLQSPNPATHSRPGFGRM